MRHENLLEVKLPKDTPLLMQAQTFPWNGDGYLAGEVLRLRDAHGLTSALETGTCLGVTSSWLAQHFEYVATCEAHQPFYARAFNLLHTFSGNVSVHLLNSPQFLHERMGANPMTAYFIFLDAHGISGTGEEHCPLLEELSVIAHYCEIGATKPCLLIHDFEVPASPAMGFDKMPNGEPFNLELVEPYMDRIYGVDRWTVNYPTKTEGANRGWASFAPDLEPNQAARP